MQTRIYSLVLKEIKTILLRNIHTRKCLLETHYDVMKLPRSCTSQEIRSSFIKLSKEYHPDKNTKDEKRHALFVRLNEAYTVLSRPDTRKRYDLSLILDQSATTGTYSTNRYNEARNFKDPFFWGNYDQSETKYDTPYYGVKGVKKMSNAWIVFFCIIFSAVGVGLQLLVIQQSATLSQKVWKENALTYAKIRERAAREGSAAALRRIELEDD